MSPPPAPARARAGQRLPARRVSVLMRPTGQQGAAMNRKRIWGWWFFDWASQPYATLLLTFIFSIYFAEVAQHRLVAEGVAPAAAGAQAPRGLASVQLGHAHIHEDDVEETAFAALQRRHAVGGRGDVAGVHGQIRHAVGRV